MHSNTNPKRLESWIEGALLATRFAIAIPVVVCVLLALAALYVATVDAVYVLGHLIAYASSISTPASDLRVDLVTAIIKSFDTYLIAAVLLIFAVGLYELFVNRLTAAESKRLPGGLLFAGNLDDLKNRLARLVLLVLVVEVLQQGLQMTYTSALDVMELAVAALLVGAAIFLGDFQGRRSAPDTSETRDAHEARLASERDTWSTWQASRPEDSSPSARERTPSDADRHHQDV